MCFSNLGFSFFPFPYIACLPDGFFWEGCCYCTCIQSLQKGFGSYCAGLGAAWKNRGWRGEELERNLLVTEWHIESHFPLHLSDMRSFSDAVDVPRSEIPKPAVPPGCILPWMGPSMLARSWPNSKVAGHIPSVMRNLLYQGLSWTGASPAAWGLHLICI